MFSQRDSVLHKTALPLQRYPGQYNFLLLTYSATNHHSPFFSLRDRLPQYNLFCASALHYSLNIPLENPIPIFILTLSPWYKSHLFNTLPQFLHKPQNSSIYDSPKASTPSSLQELHFSLLPCNHFPKSIPWGKRGETSIGHHHLFLSHVGNCSLLNPPGARPCLTSCSTKQSRLGS